MDDLTQSNSLEVADDAQISVVNSPVPMREFLKPGSMAHDRILTNLKGFFDVSHNAMSERKSVWDKSIKLYNAFIDLEAEDKDRQKKARPDATYPGTAPIVVPASTASVHTVIVYMLSVFDAIRPYFQLEGRSTEDMNNSEMMEILLDYQAQQNRFMRVLYHWVQDALVFNLGVVRCGWDKKFNYQTVLEEKYSLLELSQNPLLRQEMVRNRKWVTDYEGNQITNIDPYCFYPDPRVPVCRLNDGEFVGFIFNESKTNILKKEMQGIYFNVKQMDETPKSIIGIPTDKDTNNLTRQRVNSTQSYPGVAGMYPTNRDVPQIPEIAEIEVDLVPSDEKWRLPNPTTGVIEDNPQKWIFTAINGSLITRAEPFDNNHQRFSAIPVEFYSDGQSFLNKGYLEFLKPLNDILDWEINSRMEGVRKVHNDMIVVDPAYVNMDDIMNPSPGKLIRLLDGASSMGIDNVIRQLQTHDVTQSHFSLDIPVVMNMFQRIGVPDNIIGIPAGGRKTAREVAGIQTGATSKLRIFTRLFSETGLQELADIMIQNNQQYMSMPHLQKIGGDMLRQLNIRPDGRGFIRINPDDILGKFDYIPHDGSYPMDKMQEAAFWKEYLQTVGAIPPLAQRTNWEWVVEQIARALGIKNFSEALLPAQQVQVRPDQEVVQGLQRGNLVPQGGTNSASFNQPVQTPVGGEATMEGMMRR